MLEPVTEPVLAAEADVEMLEPVMERGGPYDTEGMSKAEYLDSLDTIMRDEYGYSDEEVEKALDILEEEIAQEVG